MSENRNSFFGHALMRSFRSRSRNGVNFRAYVDIHDESGKTKSKKMSTKSKSGTAGRNKKKYGGITNPSQGKEGFMEKKTGFISGWKTRYFVLMHDVLCYFKREDQKESMTPTGRIFFSDIYDMEAVGRKARPFCIFITTDSKKHILSCSSDEERQSWIKSIQDGKEHFINKERTDPVRRKSARLGKEMKRVTIQKDDNHGIGCTIKNVGGAIFVNRIIPDGPVAVSGVLRPGDQIVDINGIKISGSPIEKIKEVIKQSPEYVVCTVKPVTHYAHQEDSPTLPRTAYTELDPSFLKSLSSEDLADTDGSEGTGSPDVHDYANVEIGQWRHRSGSDPAHLRDPRAAERRGSADNALDYVNIDHDLTSGHVQNYAELDFSRNRKR